MMTATKTMTKTMTDFFNALNDYIEADVDGWDRESFLEFFKDKAPLSAFKKAPKEKDPHAPKRARTAYQFFMSDPQVKKQVKEENPDATAKEVTSLMREWWSDIKDTDDAIKYQNMHKKDKKRYEKDIDEYTPPTEEEIQEMQQKKKKQPKQPKRPRSAYQFYCEKNRPIAREEILKENPDLKGKELNSLVVSTLSEWWKDCKDYHDNGDFRDKDGKFDYTEEGEIYYTLAFEAKKNFVYPESPTKKPNKKPTKKPNKKPTKKPTKKTKKCSGSECSLDSECSGSECSGSECSECSESESDCDLNCGFVYKRGNKKTGVSKGDVCGEKADCSGFCKKHKHHATKNE